MKHLAITGCLFLCGCVTPVTAVKIACISPTILSPERLNRIAGEYAQLADGAELKFVVKDWIAMRDAARACAASQTH